MRLDGKRIVITGASGIAEASTLRLAREGASIFVISKEEAECESLAARAGEAGFEIGWVVGDLSAEAEAEAAFGIAHRHLGGLDGLMAVAGGSGRSFGDAPLGELSRDAWDKTLALNATPAFLSAREAIRLMNGGGSVLLISSVLAGHPSRLFATHAYAAAKGAINSFALAAAAEYASIGIRVNVISPGLVRTPMSARAASDPGTVGYARSKQPLADGMIEPAAIADAAVFLLSDEAAQITGQILEVDGGWSVSETMP